MTRKTPRKTNPATEAKKLQLEATRLENLCLRIDAVSSAVDLRAIAELRQQSDAYAVAQHAATLAASTLRSGETVLPGTGEEAWKVMFNAARKFSEEQAYPEHAFPHVTDDALCPLCQQQLESDGASRLQRFDAYLKTVGELPVSIKF